MKSFKECKACIQRQAIQVTELAVKDKKTREKIFKEVEKALNSMDIESMSPPEATEIIHKIVKRISGIIDPYDRLKKESNELALNLYSKMKEMVTKAPDPLNMAVRLAIAGNIIDYGALASFDVESKIQEALKMDFAINHYDELVNSLGKAKRILYIGDNSGEIVFDKLLIEQLPKNIKVTYVVRSEPTLNDVLVEDARLVKMDEVADVIQSGSSCAGTILEKTTQEFKEALNSSDFVIAKGQGNYETIERFKKQVFILLTAKCPHIARKLEIKKGDIIVLCMKG